MAKRLFLKFFPIHSSRISLFLVLSPVTLLEGLSKNSICLPRQRQYPVIRIGFFGGNLRGFGVVSKAYFERMMF